MDMKNNDVDLVIGPIETYEDQFGYKTAFSHVLIKDKQWSDRLAKYAQFLPELQRGLPVEDKYKQEMPGANAQPNAYDAVYFAGSTRVAKPSLSTCQT